MNTSGIPHHNNQDTFTQFKHDLLEAFIMYQSEQNIIDDDIINDVYDGYDIAEQQVSMSMDECLWYEEQFEMLCDMFGNDPGTIPTGDASNGNGL